HQWLPLEQRHKLIPDRFISPKCVLSWQAAFNYFIRTEAFPTAIGLCPAENKRQPPKKRSLEFLFPLNGQWQMLPNPACTIGNHTTDKPIGTIYKVSADGTKRFR